MSILVSDHERIRVIAIDRPKSRNAVDGPTARQLFEAFVAFDEDASADVAILTGTGGTFCAGADLKALSRMRGANPIEPGGTGTMAPMGPSRLQLSKPVVAAIEGHAVAGGLELALWCDLRVVARDAIFGVFCRRFGVPLVDLGTIRLPRLIGHSRAMDLILTGRAVEAEEALAIGLANRVCDPGTAMQAALALSARIAAFPQTCLRSDRRSAIEQWDHDWETACRREFGLGLSTIESGETEAGAARFARGLGRHGRFDADEPG